MQRVTVHVLIFAVILLGTIHGSLTDVYPDVYIHQDSLTYQWTPASGGVDFYEVFVSVNGEAYKIYNQVMAPATGGSLRCRLRVEDLCQYRIKVRAVSETMGPGPFSNPSEPVMVFLNGTADDTDGDVLPNDWEERYGLNPFDPADALADADGDLLSNQDEYLEGTHPLDPDSDHDGVEDGTEMLAGMNPLNPLDNIPRADAGQDLTVKPGKFIALSGLKSWDPNGDPLFFEWVQEEGPSLTVLGLKAPIALFYVFTPGRYVFSLVVSDGKAYSNPDRIRIWVSDETSRPEARAGRDFLAPMEGPVILDGTESTDPEGRTLNFTWEQVSGPHAVLESANASMPSFQPPDPGTYVFELTVDNGIAMSIQDSVSVQVVEELVPGDIFPHGNPDEILNILDLTLWWFFYYEILIPDEDEFFAIDVAPMTILDPEGEPVGIRLEPDGYFSLEDGILLGEISRGIYRVIGWEDDSE